MNKIQNGFAIYWSLKASGTGGLTLGGRLLSLAAAAIESAYLALAVSI